jgi:fucose 4-O-acetylase-like acetyltransferase
MILVMAGHGDIPFRLALSFVPVPIFFFLSGYLYHEWKYNDIRQLIRVRARTLLVPYLIFALLNYAVWAAFHPAVLTHGWAAALGPLLNQVLAGRRTDEDPYLVPYWFILCLFLVEVLYALVAMAGNSLAKLTGSRSLGWRALLVGLVTASGFIYVSHGIHALPWSLDVALIAIAFYATGHFAQLSSDRFDLLFRKRWLVAPAIAGLVLGALNMETAASHRVGLYHAYYHDPLLFLLGSYSGLYIFLFLIFRMPDFKPVRVIGQESLTFLVLHYPIFLPMGAFVDGVIFPDWRTAPIFAHSPLLHSLTIRVLKALVGTVITAAGLVVAYLVIAPIAKAIRSHTTILSGGRNREPIAVSDGEAIARRAPDGGATATTAVPEIAMKRSVGDCRPGR